jgi:hypothetical protein
MAPPAWGQGIEVQPGRIVGDIQFKNAAALEAHLTGDPVVLGWESVRATAPSLQVAARAGYEPAGSQAADGTYTAAHFDLVVDVGSWGSSFTLGVRSLQFASGAWYRFGPVSDWSEGGHPCSGVQPVATQPDGTRCDIAETAALLNVRVRFVGPDVGNLDGSAPVICRVTAWEEGVPQAEDAQATTADVPVMLADLLGAGAVLPLVVRSGPSTLGVSCLAAARGGSSCTDICFVIDPVTGRTPLGTSLSVDLAGGAAVEAPVDVVVQKNAGVLKGKLDVVGHPIVSGEVILDDPDWGLRLPLDPEPGYTPPLEWSFCGAPAGWHGVIASALLDDERRAVVLPYKDGPNGQAFVPLCATEDLGSTFVTRPAVATGLLRLRSPIGSPLLSSLALGSLRWHSASDPEGWSVQSSFAQATGSPAVPAGGASGYGAFSRASLLGTIDAERRNADLGYSLLLPGIGTENGPLDGTGARRTSWDVSRFGLRWGDWTENQERLWLTSGFDLHYSGVAQGQELVVPDQEVCLARVGLNLRIDPDEGRLRNASLSFRSVGPFLTPASPAGTPLADAVGDASEPWAGDEGSPEVSVPAVLAAGFQYELRPSASVSLGLVGSSSWSYVYLHPPMIWPSEGALACGASAEICGSVGSAGEMITGAVSILDATGTTSAPTEATGAALSLSIHVQYSVDMRPDRVSYALDPSGTAGCQPGETVLCDGNCPDPARFDVTLSGLSAGSHSFRVCTRDGLVCNPATGHTFTVPPPPCPPGFTVVAPPGATSVPATDPRIASRLVATVPEGWPAPEDNRPLSFPLGQTVVHFTFGDQGGCDTTVRVVPAHIGVTGAPPQPGQGRVELHDLSGPQDLDTTLAHFPDAGSDYAFSADGHRLVVAGGGLSAIVRLPGSSNDSATVTSLAVPAAAQVSLGLPAGPWKVAWKPQSTDVYAVLGQAGAPPRWKVQIVRETHVLGGLELPALPSDVTDVRLTAIGFSPGGHSVTVAGTARKPTGPGAGWYYVLCTWTLSGAGTSGSPTPTVKFRRIPGQDRVHDILVLEGGRVLMVAGKGLFQVQGAAWTLLFARKNAHGVVLPGGEGALLAEMTNRGVRLVHHRLATGQTRAGPAVSPGKLMAGEVAASPDARFGALLAGAGDYVYVYRLDNLTPASAPVRTPRTTTEFARHPAFRPY